MSLSDNDRARFLSFVMRDQPPSVDESKAVHAGTTTVTDLVDQWLDSEGMRRRAWRYFNDMFGNANPTGLRVTVIYRTQQGVHFKPAGGPCAPNQAVQVQPWWTDQTILACPSLVDNPGELQTPQGPVSCQFIGNQLSQCGCGPNMALCLPGAFVDTYLTSVYREPAMRGQWAYDHDWSWEQWLGGDKLIADRYLYHFYLASRSQVPTKDTAPFLTELLATPLGEFVETDYPQGPGAPEYAGFLTGPGFLMQHNNFRSRIAIMTEQLLCTDVGGALNLPGPDYPGGITEFINPDHDALTLQHATPECAGCHYPMDNLGSTLFGFDTSGEWDVTADISTLGYVFGEVGEGPKFLAEGYVQRGPGFMDCMARRAWEDFSSAGWETLTQAQQDELLQAAEAGPRTLLRQVVMGAPMKARR